MDCAPHYVVVPGHEMGVGLGCARVPTPDSHAFLVGSDDKILGVVEHCTGTVVVLGDAHVLVEDVAAGYLPQLDDTVLSAR